MILHAGRKLNRGLKLLIDHDDEKTPGAIERLVDELRDDKELCCYQLLNHPGSEDILWGIVRLLAFKDANVSGHAAYVLGTICDLDVGRRRILELVVTYKDEGYDVLANLTRILYCNDNESIMNASGTIGTLAETLEGRSWMLRKENLDETLSRVMVLLGSDDPWTASNAALIIARLTIEEEGCARILNRRDTRKLLLQLIHCLGIDKAGKGMNAAFAIGRICDMESGRRHMLMLKKSDYMLSKLTEMLESDLGGCNKNACFALSCIAGSADGVTRLLEHSTKENILHRLSTLLSAEDEETAWFAAMMLRTLASKKKGCLILRDYKIVKDALQERVKVVDLKSDIKEEIQMTLEILKNLAKPKPPVVKIESATTANVHWDVVSPKSGLEVTYKLFLGCPEERVVYCGQETSFELQSLQPTKTYHCRLQTSTEGDESPISQSISFTLPESVPSAPQNARVLGRTTTQLKLGWDPPNSPNGVVKGYHIYQQGKNGFVDTRDLYCIFINLVPGTEYSFEIYAFTSAGRGEKADVTCATVDLREYAPAKPNLHVLGRNEIFVQWNAPERPLGRINFYEVTQDGEVIYSGIERSCTSSRLQANTEYTFKVAAWTSEGKCESEPAKKRTPKNTKFNFPREPLYPYDKKAKNGKPTQERIVNSESTHSQQQRAKSVSFIKISETTRDKTTRPRTSAEPERNQPKRTLGSNLSLQWYTTSNTSSNNSRESLQLNSVWKRHSSGGTVSASDESMRQVPIGMRKPPDHPTIITIPPPVAKDGRIGLGFRPASYSALPKQPLRSSRSADYPATANGAQNGTHPRAKKTVSFGTPFSRALDDLRSINRKKSNNNNNRHFSNDFPTSLRTRSISQSSNALNPRRRIKSSSSTGSFS